MFGLTGDCLINERAWMAPILPHNSFPLHSLYVAIGCCDVISSPDGVEWFTARVEEVECQWPPHDQVVPVSLPTSGL